jgi:hypothetical protein
MNHDWLMSNLDKQVFDNAVRKFFTSLAVQEGQQLKKVAGGVFEIQSDNFTVRIRRVTGHYENILVTLMPTAERPYEISDLSKEIGLGVVMRFHEEKEPDFCELPKTYTFTLLSSLPAQLNSFLFHI